MQQKIRSIRSDEWLAVKELRLASLQDEVAHLAFLETYEEAAAKPDSFWQERAAGAAEGALGVQQFIAETPDGDWGGTVTVLMEEAGTTDWAGHAVERRQAHIVGVFVRREHRGTGLIKALFDAGLEWAWGRGAERVRLLVHEDNGRAGAAYRKMGFVPSGVTVRLSEGSQESELEMVIERN
ncbi:GNAT family N-acetyltransferase [Streptomyces sp. NPDC052051]|uniref:GNAT family N-acetyltransferase n=1 Tax=Streptomyces sp. NPDC052051 TaxID=3154649 RepID=UPI003416F9C0